MVNKAGPRTLPCGIPDTIVSTMVTGFPILTYRVL